MVELFENSALDLSPIAPSNLPCATRHFFGCAPAADGKSEEERVTWVAVLFRLFAQLNTIHKFAFSLVSPVIITKQAHAYDEQRTRPCIIWLLLGFLLCCASHIISLFYIGSGSCSPPPCSLL